MGLGLVDPSLGISSAAAVATSSDEEAEELDEDKYHWKQNFGKFNSRQQLSKLQILDLKEKTENISVKLKPKKVVQELRRNPLNNFVAESLKRPPPLNREVIEERAKHP